MLEPVKILVVDDLPEKLLVYRAILDQPGLEVVQASSGSDALKQVLLQDFAVILLDINMPDMDGFEAAQLIRSRKRCAHTPIIFITSYADELHALKGYAYGAVDYILAPVVPEVLQTKIGVFVQLFRKTQEAQRQAEALREMQLREHRRELNETNQRLQFALQAGRMGAWEWEIDLDAARQIVAHPMPESSDQSPRAPAQQRWLKASLVNWSPTLEEIFGFSGADGTGAFTGSAQQLYERLHPEDADRVMHSMAQAALEARELQLEHRIVRPGPSGHEVAWIEVRGRLVEPAASLDQRADGDSDVGSALPHRMSSLSPIVPSVSTARLVGVCMDITQRKAAEEELARHRGRLEELVRHRTQELEQSLERLRLADRLASIGTLAAGLGHDMGNLLLPIRMRLETLQRSIDNWHPDDAPAASTSQKKGRSAAATGSQIKTQIQRDLHAIATSTEYLKRLSQGLRLFSLDPEEISGVSQMTDLDAWWPDVEPFLRNALPRTVRLEAGAGRIPSDLNRRKTSHAAGAQSHDQTSAMNGMTVSRPFAGLPPVGMASHRFTQAIYNLVQNAGEVLRDRPSGLVRITAEISDGNSARAVTAESNGATKASPFIVVSVSDDGPGMNEETRRRCMEPFFTTKTRAISTGLGLALVRGAVTQAGGHIEIDSTPGNGATFKLWLPIAATHSLDQAGSETPGHSLPTSRACVKLSDARIGAYVTMLLQSHGIEVRKDPWDAESDLGLIIIDSPNGRIGELHQFLAKDGRRRAVILGEWGSDNAPTARQITCIEPKPAPPRLRDVIQSVVAGPAIGKRAAEP